MSKPTANFNANDLATVVPGLIITATNPYVYPTRTLYTNALAAADKSVTSGSNYTEKKVIVSAEIGQNTRELLDAAIDTMNGYLTGKEKTLILSWAGATRQWTATLDNVTYHEVLGGYASFDLEFELSDPFGYDVSTTNLFSTSLTGSTSTTNFIGIIGGSADWQAPIITITFTAITGGTSKVVTVGNPANGQTCTITRSWTSADVLVINSQTKTVTVNGTEVATTGACPEWASGAAGSMSYTDTFTTRTRTMSGLYTKRHI